jgi:hypothetical protein
MVTSNIPHNWRVIDSTNEVESAQMRSFSHLVTDAGLGRLTHSTIQLARELKGSFSKAIFWSPSQESRLDYFDQHRSTFVTENPSDFGLSFLTFETVEKLAEALSSTLVLYGFREATQTLYCNRFVDGQPKLAWCDSLRPGPSFAREYRADGSATGMDPRQYASAALDVDDNQHRIDRRAFLTKQLEDFGIEDPMIPPNPSSRSASLYLSRDQIELADFDGNERLNA